MNALRGAALVVAALSTGLMAGVFGIFANAIMPGLRRADDRTFVGAFQRIDRAIINPFFMATFVGALLTSGVAAALHFGEDDRSVLPWAIAAFLLYLWVFVNTIAVNVPLNDELKAAGEPDRIADLSVVRARFNEAKWVRWNLVRAVSTLAAFVCLLWALVEYGQNV